MSYLGFEVPGRVLKGGRCLGKTRGRGERRWDGVGSFFLEKGGGLFCGGCV